MACASVASAQTAITKKSASNAAATATAVTAVAADDATALAEDPAASVTRLDPAALEAAPELEAIADDVAVEELGEAPEDAPEDAPGGLMGKGALQRDPSATIEAVDGATEAVEATTATKLTKVSEAAATELKVKEE